ncbi:MAG TPA: enoyl-CoA hydratase-related protein [Syntrophales bacterium]|jgi:enoyl-CoA hydratase|nr:enoyl-CoA hydratase-related protein [Syntrophales bacterium]
MERKYVNYAIENRLAVVTIDNPKMNALSDEVMDELDAVFDELEARTEIGVAIITGGGTKAFVAGADIKGFEKLMGNRQGAINDSRRMQAVFSKIENSRLVVIAAINGLALGGGCELAIACDIRVAGDSIVIGVPEVKLGLIPGAGGTQRLVRLLGKGPAKYMIFTGEFLNAQEAYRLGLVDRVVPEKDVLAAAKKIAATILGNAPLAVEAGKRAINRGVEMSLEDGLMYEAKLEGDLFLTKDLAEGVSAFIEKRTPIFRRR